MPQYTSIEIGDTAGVADELGAMRDLVKRDLDKRLSTMARALEEVTPRLNALR
jgi:hypothetical protein